MTRTSGLTHSPARPATIRRLRLASAAAVFPLALAAAPHASAGPAAPGTAADHTFTHTCTRTVDGQSLKVNIAIAFNKANSNDITGVTVRATDNGESGSYDNNKVNITKSKVQIVGPSNQVTVSKTSAGSPLTVSANPAGTGKNARSVKARVDWKVGSNRTAFVTCFYIDE